MVALLPVSGVHPAFQPAASGLHMAGPDPRLDFEFRGFLLSAVRGGIGVRPPFDYGRAGDPDAGHLGPGATPVVPYRGDLHEPPDDPLRRRHRDRSTA
ncbi:hypothetical protein D3C87_1781490 [compost metagenome]